ncbi:MAG: peptidylprolyl isomerase [Ignavibacteriales bacterium]|nr:peptidylprolyl isomerase [Ignavibacteriales bacterium]
MPMMARMRSLAPWFMLTVGGVFVLFMVLSDSKVTDLIHQQKQNVGSIDGEEVTYQEYSNAIDNLKKQQEQAGQTIDESQMDFFRDQVWDYIVAQKLIAKKIKDFGIVVTDDEVRNTLLGPNPPAQLTQQFKDSTGNFNRQAYEGALKDPRNKQIVIGVEDQIKEQLVQQKLQSYVSASITVSDAEAKDQYFKQAIKMKAGYVLIDANTIPDADVKVTDADIKKYYDEHPEDFKQVAERKLKYVLFRKEPSQDDSIAIKKNLEAIVTKMKGDTASFKSYVQIYSERPYSKDTVSLSTVPVDIRDALVKGKNGEILGPVATPEGYVVYKLNDKVKSKKEQVRASHILVKSTGNDNADLQKANEIYNQLMKGADFTAVAKEKSDDGSKFQGGDLGWFGRGQMVKPFEDASFNGKVGVIQKPIKSPFGYHIIKVTDKSNQDFVVEKIVNKIQPSATTADKLYQDAQDFSFVAKKDGFENEAKVMKYAAIETPSFDEEAQGIPGIGVNRALVKFAFDNSVGEVSDVFRVAAGHVVVMVSDVTKPGVKNFDATKAQIKNTLTLKMKLNKAASIAKDIRSKIDDNGDGNIAKTIWPSARVDTTTEFTSFGSIPGIGRDFAFSEYASKGDLNKWSEPVKGNSNVYLIKVNFRTNYDPSLFEAQKAEIKKQLLFTKKSNFYGQWIQDLKKEATIVDNRFQFYR